MTKADKDKTGIMTEGQREAPDFSAVLCREAVRAPERAEEYGRYRGLIALDMDGTWLRDDKTVSPAMRLATRQARERGFLVIPATGRPIGGLTMEVMKEPGIGYAVSANGAAGYRIIDYPSGNWQQIFLKRVPEEQADRVIGICRKYDLDTDCFVGGIGHLSGYSKEKLKTYGYPEGLCRYILESRDSVEDLFTYYEEHRTEVEKIMIHIGITPERKKLRPVVEKELEQIGGLSIVCGGVGNFEITAADATKGRGITRLADYLGIPREHIMACGDEENDLDMIRSAAFGVAMGNAPGSVRREADYVTETNENDGAALAIGVFVEKVLKEELAGGDLTEDGRK